MISLISDVRSARTETNIPPGARLEAYVKGGAQAERVILKRNWPTISKLARMNWSDLPSDQLGQGNTIQVMAGEMVIALQLEGIIDLDAERARLAKAIAAAEKDRDGLAARLANPAFAERAKPEAVDKARADHDARAAEADRLSAALARLG